MSTDVYSLLSEPIRRYIRDRRWESFRPIQSAAIIRIMTTDKNYILASPTASGKTEAVFLPVLSKVNFEESGVQVLYISPLIALINDQTQRIEDLCRYLDVTITKWHGEASRSAKNRVLKAPSGVILITPESLEAMFVNRPYDVKSLFSNLKYIIIDEIHYFIGTDRGIQLKSLLSRLQSLQPQRVTILGLSATIGDYNEAKKFTGDPASTVVLRDSAVKRMQTQFKYIGETKQGELPLELLKQLYVDVRDKNVLIFPNSRGRVEEVAVKLNLISNRVGGSGNYFAHHSAVDKEKREYIEFLAKNSNKPFAIACTSTLELGIDIGSIDTVVQIDSTFNVSSLVQRVGRSGRKDDACSNLLLYTTSRYHLLQSLACWHLNQKGIVEPPDVVEYPYDLLAHQILSITKECCGVGLEQLIRMVAANFAFSAIALDDIKHLVKHLLKMDILEHIDHEVILGVEGEKVVNTRDFYTSFVIEHNFKIIYMGSSIGELPFGPQLQVGVNIFLSARIWTINDIDWNSRKAYVAPALDGKRPSFGGSGGAIPDVVAQEMLDILYSDDTYDILDAGSIQELSGLRHEFSKFGRSDYFHGRPLYQHDGSTIIYPFVGSKKMNALKVIALQLEGVGVEVQMRGHIPIVKLGVGMSLSTFVKLSQGVINDIDGYFFDLLKEGRGQQQLSECSKWGFLLPLDLQVKVLKQKLYDFVPLV